MKRFFFILIWAILLGSTIANAGWWRTYGPGGDGCCVQITSDNNYIVCGTKGIYVWLLKVDTLGNLIWQRTYPGGDGLWVEETSDKGYVIAKSPGIIKTDSVGDTIWTRDYGVATNCVQETPDNGYVIAGVSYDERLALVRTNSQGDTLWTRFYSEPGNNLNRGYFVQNTNDGGFIVTGYTGYVEGEYSWTLLWLLKINSAGDKQWSKTYGISGDFSEGNCVRQTSKGGYVVVGGRGNNLWLLLIDSSGDTIRTKTYSSANGGLGLNVGLTSDSGYIVTGITTSALLASYSPALNDLWLLKMNSEGDTEWTRNYGGDNSEAGRCGHQTPDVGYIVTGYASSFGPNHLYLLKTDSIGLLDIQENPRIETPNNWELFTIIGRQLVLRYWDMPQGFQASIYDASGRKVDVLNSYNSCGTISLGSGFLSGVYFIRVQNKTKVATAKVVIVK